MHFLKHPLVILSFTLFSLLFSLSLYSNWKRNQNTASQVALLEEEVQQMSSEVTQLEQAAKSASGSAATEKIIRDQLLMQKSGETVLQLPEIETEKSVVAATGEKEQTIWQQWREVLFR